MWHRGLPESKSRYQPLRLHWLSVKVYVKHSHGIGRKLLHCCILEFSFIFTAKSRFLKRALQLLDLLATTGLQDLTKDPTGRERTRNTDVNQK